MHGLDFASDWTWRAHGRFDAFVVRIALDLRNQLGAGGGRNGFRVSRKELRQSSHQNMLDAWQTNSTEKRKRERPDLGDKNCSPGFLMVADLDCDVASARRQFEFQKKSAFSCFRKIGISDGNQRSRPLPTRLEDRSASQCSANNSTNSVSGQTLAMQKPTGDFGLLVERNAFQRRIEMKHIICDRALRHNWLSHFDRIWAVFNVTQLSINSLPRFGRSWRKSQGEEIFSERKVGIIKGIVLQLIAPLCFHVVDLR